MGRRNPAQVQSQHLSMFEKITIGAGFAISISTFVMGLMAVFAGYTVVNDKLKNAEEKAELLLKKIEEHEKTSAKKVEEVSKNSQQIIVGKDFSKIMSMGMPDELIEKAKTVSKDKSSNNIRRADALLELYNKNYETALTLWEKVLEHDANAADAIFYCCFLHLVFAEDTNNVKRLFESEKYLKNIPKEAINVIFTFIDITLGTININSLDEKERDAFFSYIEWIYTKIENTKESFELYHRWGYIVMQEFIQPKRADVNLIHRSKELFAKAEKLIKIDTTIPERERIIFYKQYADVFVALAYNDMNNAATYWKKGHDILDRIKYINDEAKYEYAVFLYKENQFYNRLSEKDLGECITILEELKKTSMRSNALSLLGGIYHFIYNNEKKDLDLLVKSSEYMRATISLQNPNNEKCKILLDALYTLASKTTDNNQYIRQANYLFHNFNLLRYITPDIFEYQIKFMLLTGAPEKDILSAFSGYQGPIPRTLLVDPQIKKIIDTAYGLDRMDSSTQQQHLPDEKAVNPSVFE